MSQLVDALPKKGIYRVKVRDSRQSPIKLFAPHGGNIEPGTHRLVREIAQEDWDYFLFIGLMKKNCFRNLHVTSTNYDEKTCLRMARASRIAIAIHGSTAGARKIEVGGGNRADANDLIQYLQRLGHPARKTSGNLEGTHISNFINLAENKGIQIELSKGFRKHLFLDYPKCFLGNPEALPYFAWSLRLWIKKLEREL